MADFTVFFTSDDNFKSVKDYLCCDASLKFIKNNYDALVTSGIEYKEGLVTWQNVDSILLDNQNRKMYSVPSAFQGSQIDIWYELLVVFNALNFSNVYNLESKVASEYKTTDFNDFTLIEKVISHLFIIEHKKLLYVLKIGNKERRGCKDFDRLCTHLNLLSSYFQKRFPYLLNNDFWVDNEDGPILEALQSTRLSVNTTNFTAIYKKRKAIENKSDPFYFGTVSEEECISLSQYLEPFSISPVATNKSPVATTSELGFNVPYSEFQEGSSRIMGSTICGFKPVNTSQFFEEEKDQPTLAQLMKKNPFSKY